MYIIINIPLYFTGITISLIVHHTILALLCFTSAQSSADLCIADIDLDL